jgi:hypothetical protein
MATRTYESAGTFKQALEQRLRTTSRNGVDFSRRRQLLVFDRFLARTVAVFGDAVLLKGGLALEIRLERARTTKDIDFRMTGSADALLERLRSAGQKDLGDFMFFEICADPHQPNIQTDGMQYEGLRFRAECRLAGRLYAQPFGIDVAFGDPILGDPMIITTEDWLAFAGISPPTLRLCPIETHIAEKLHAYTMPRARPNTRVKDLPDIALLATADTLDANQLRTAFQQTFEFRGTHMLPMSLPDPPPTWDQPYSAMARENELPWMSLGQLAVATREFLDPVLDGSAGTWQPAEWTWDFRGGSSNS